MTFSVYQRIVRASDRGGGVRLSPEDCVELALDDAIATRAAFDDDPAPEDAVLYEEARRISASKKRSAGPK